VYNFFIPTVSGVTPTDMERLLGFLYSLFFMSGLINGLFHVILGIGFMNLGKNNRDPGGVIAMIGGILYLVAWIVNLVLTIISKLGGWYGLTLPGPIVSILNILSWVINFVVLGSVVLILVYSFLTKRPLFIIFALLFFAAYLLQILSLLGFI
jgi:hypothetical protein